MLPDIIRIHGTNQLTKILSFKPKGKYLVYPFVADEIFHLVEEYEITASIGEKWIEFVHFLSKDGQYTHYKCELDPLFGNKW